MINFHKFSKRAMSSQSWRNLPKFSIEEFLGTTPKVHLDDEACKTYIKKACQQSLISVSEQEEKQFISDFK